MFNIDENKNIEIAEKYLDENIPRDLFRLYNNRPYPSQRNPDTKHFELHNTDNRRSILYDYGKAQYRVISAQEAIQMVKNNKQEIQNLRIIFDGYLVEYELRDNGSIYAIYRDPSSVTINGKYYKNIGYAPWQQVINFAEKIYWTDEYSRKLSAEEIAKRSEKNAERIMYKGLSPQDQRYDPHTPFYNLSRGETLRAKAIPDTGDHSGYISYTPEHIRQRYTKYDLARKALKKLEQEKELYDNKEEYEELKVKLEKDKKDALDRYNSALETKRIQDTMKVKEISIQTHQFNIKLAEYTRAIQKALSDSYELKKKLDNLLTTTTNTSNTSTASLNSLRKDLANVVTALNDDTQILADAQDRSQSEEKVKELLDKITEYKTEFVNDHLKDLAKIEHDIKDIEDQIDRYRPSTAAKKARIAAAQFKEMPADLLNVIDFVSF